MDLTFAALLTPEGVIAAAALTTSVVALLRNVSPALDARVSGASLAFLLTAMLYGLGAIAVGVDGLDAALGLFVAWVACATSAVGIHSTVKHVAG